MFLKELAVRSTFLFKMGKGRRVTGLKMLGCDPNPLEPSVGVERGTKLVVVA